MLKATAEHTNAITAYRMLGFLVRPPCRQIAKKAATHGIMPPVMPRLGSRITARYKTASVKEQMAHSDQHDMYLSAAIHQSDAVTANALIETLLRSLNQNNVMKAWESYTDLRSRDMIQHLTRDNFRLLVTYFQNHSSGNNFQHGIEFILSLVEDMMSLGYTVGRREKLSMMRVLGLNGRLYEMEQVFQDLEAENLLIVAHDDQKPFRILLSSYESNTKTLGKPAVVEKTLQVYDLMIDKGVLADTKTTHQFLQILHDASSQNQVVDDSWKWFWNRIGMEVGNEKSVVHPSLYKGMAMLFAAAGKAEQALEIHDLMIKRGIPRDLQLMTAVMHKIGRAGNVDKADELFHAMNVEGMIPTTVTYNALIDVHAHLKPSADVDGALRTYHTMLEAGIAPDVQTFGTLIHMYAKQGDVKPIQTFYSDMVHKYNIKPNVHIFTAVMQCFVQLQDLPAAKEVIQLMKKQKIDPDTVVHNTLLHFHARKKDTRQALTVLDYMIESGVKPSVVTFSHILSIYAQIGDVTGGEQLIERMMQMDIRPNRQTYNSLMNLYSQAGDIESVERTFKDLSTQYPPDLVSYNTLLQAYIRQNDLESVLDTYKRLGDAYHKADVYTYAHLMTAFSSRRNIRGVEGVFNNMKTQNVQPNSVCWSILIQAYCRMNDIENARKTLQQMIESNVTPNQITLAILVDGCVQADELDTARVILDKVIQDAQQERGAMVSNAIPESLSNSYMRRLPTVVEDLFDMNFDRPEPYSTPLPQLFMPLANGYIERGDFEAAKDVFRQAFQVGIKINPVMYVTLMKLYRAEGNLDMVKSLWDHWGSPAAIEDFGELDAVSGNKSQFALSVLIDALADTTEVDQVESIWQHLEESNYAFDAHNYNRYVCALIKMGKVDDACKKANQLLQQPMTSNRRPRDHADTYAEQLFRGTKSVLLEAYGQNHEPFKVYPMVLESIQYPVQKAS
ncbi:hypothetical protein INT43_001434 [Umbelopsis isabellina]|uniref:Pentatricopeptide repeat-containing protein-mitochondrial domain-containing protein n=1 Tax=Mortierella isabellina TaxID=91625 RepID=A0A8H7PDL0_MORIS|nr:hypothetical protein INT43_001434 [Umbelopsis isabellina]